MPFVDFFVSAFKYRGVSGKSIAAFVQLRGQKSGESCRSPGRVPLQRFRTLEAVWDVSKLYAMVATGAGRVFVFAGRMAIEHARAL